MMYVLGGISVELIYLIAYPIFSEITNDTTFDNFNMAGLYLSLLESG